MNLWDIFFTTQATEPPQFDLVWYVSLFTLLALTFYASYRYYDKKRLSTFFPNFASCPVGPSLQLVLGKSHASVRKFTILSLSYGDVCSAITSW